MRTGLARFRFHGSGRPCITGDLIRHEPALGEPLDVALPICGAEVVWAARREMARTVEDVLARRTRALFLNARAALRMAFAGRDCSPVNWVVTPRGSSSNCPRSRVSPGDICRCRTCDTIPCLRSRSFRTYLLRIPSARQLGTAGIYGHLGIREFLLGSLGKPN